jgi:gamma-glutamyltranspeptidase/glutathione hydrolase
MSESSLNRRELLVAIGSAALAAGRPCSTGAAGASTPGVISGDPLGEEVGRQVLSEGGNAVDAVAAAALVAATTNLANCGMGGYGGHMTLAFADGKVTSIDFNSAAPATATADLFAARGATGGYGQRGWIAAGVPGTLAGIQMAISRYGTRPLADLIRPAIDYAREGFSLPGGTAQAIRRAGKQLRSDPGSAKLLFPDGEPPRAGSTFRNPDLAKMLQTLAEANSVEPFYRGEIGRRIAAAFRNNGGLVTADDMAQYRAREVRPLRLAWRGYDVFTAPLTAGGATVIQILKVLDTLDCTEIGDEPSKTHTRLEAQRIAWHDRLTRFGDPDFVDVPLERLLSDAYAAVQAERVRHAVRQRRPVDVGAAARNHGGTCHLSAADQAGNLAAMTLTHGGGFGAQITVDGLGLILGHGMSRFDPDPVHPNCPGPGKRPLHNMCPTVVLKESRPLVALGGRGGRRIPNAVANVLLDYVGRSAAVSDAVAAARLHTEGDRVVMLEGGWAETTARHLSAVGYSVRRGKVAVVDAASFDPRTGALSTASK